jgi:hypothetical protein
MRGFEGLVFWGLGRKIGGKLPPRKLLISPAAGYRFHV